MTLACLPGFDFAGRGHLERLFWRPIWFSFLGILLFLIFAHGPTFRTNLCMQESLALRGGGACTRATVVASDLTAPGCSASGLCAMELALLPARPTEGARSSGVWRASRRCVPRVFGGPHIRKLRSEPKCGSHFPWLAAGSPEASSAKLKWRSTLSAASFFEPKAAGPAKGCFCDNPYGFQSIKNRHGMPRRAVHEGVIGGKRVGSATSRSISALHRSPI